MPRKSAAKRELIEPHKGDKRYVRRSAGRFTSEQDDVGRSLSQDRRWRAKHSAAPGQGDKGDRPKRKARKRATRHTRRAP